MSHRGDEADKVHFRGERVFAVNDKWFLQLRDVVEPFGPYSSRQQAERVLGVFLEDIRNNLTAAQAITHLRLVGDAYVEDSY